MLPNNRENQGNPLQKWEYTSAFVGAVPPGSAARYRRGPELAESGYGSELHSCGRAAG